MGKQKKEGKRQSRPFFCAPSFHGPPWHLILVQNASVHCIVRKNQPSQPACCGQYWSYTYSGSNSMVPPLSPAVGGRCTGPRSIRPFGRSVGIAMQLAGSLAFSLGARLLRLVEGDVICGQHCLVTPTASVASRGSGSRYNQSHGSPI